MDDIQERGIAAARAYLDRIGQSVLSANEPLPAGIDILSIDGDILVGTLTSVRSGALPDDFPTGATLDGALVALEALRASGHPERSGVRVDVIAIRVLAEDRALLRHHRGAI
jgi:hypothetical protein